MFLEKMLDSKDERISLDAEKYLMDRLYGKGSQLVDMKHSGDKEQPVPFVVKIVHIGSPELSASREYKR